MQDWLQKRELGRQLAQELEAAHQKFKLANARFLQIVKSGLSGIPPADSRLIVKGTSVDARIAFEEYMSVLNRFKQVLSGPTGTMHDRHRILIADGQVLVEEGLRRLLEHHYEIVGGVNDGMSLVEATLRLKPDLVILAVAMPLLGGIDAARQIRKSLPRTKLLFLTSHANPEYLREALRIGAEGYILKSSTRPEILAAVQSVLAGQRYISRGIVGEDFDLSKWQPGKAAGSRPVLTSRERQVLQMLAEGRSAKEVAAALNVSHKTVAFHRNNVKRKLGLRKTVELIKRAIDEGFI